MNINKFCEKCGINLDELPENMIIFNNLLKRFMSVLKFENLDETINQQVLMLSIIFNDSYMFIVRDGVLRNVWGGLSGELDFYGYPTKYLWSTGVASGEESINDGVVGHSNSLWTPIAPTIYYYSKMLSHFDTSLRIASSNTRTVPLYKATTDAERKQIDKIFDDLEKGKTTHSYVQKQTLKEIVDEAGNLPLDLTGKSGDSTYIPMILQAYDNVLARVCRELGINITNVMKRAQVISAEVNGYENYTQIYLTDLLDNVRSAFDKVNQKWGRDWKVSLSDAFEDDNPTEDTPEDEPAEDSKDDEEEMNE